MADFDGKGRLYQAHENPNFDKDPIVFDDGAFIVSDKTIRFDLYFEDQLKTVRLTKNEEGIWEWKDGGIHWSGVRRDYNDYAVVEGKFVNTGDEFSFRLELPKTQKPSP
jgi:hypothetical protein